MNTLAGRGRYLLAAYVCGCGDVRPVNDMGATTLVDIFHRRPDGCQFAIASEVPLPGWDPEFMVIDLYDLMTTGGSDTMLGRYRTLPTYDAAITAAQMQT